jgi:hypothetical protein
VSTTIAAAPAPVAAGAPAGNNGERPAHRSRHHARVALHRRAPHNARAPARSVSVRPEATQPWLRAAFTYPRLVAPQHLGSALDARLVPAAIALLLVAIAGASVIRLAARLQ